MSVLRMKLTARYGFVACLALAISTVVPPSLQACFCFPPEAPCLRKTYAEAVFVGMAIRAEPRSVEELRNRLLSALPRDVAGRLGPVFPWYGDALRDALSY